MRAQIGSASTDSLAAPRARPPGSWWLAVFGLVTLVLLPSIWFDFVWDDGWTLVGNGFLRRPQEWWSLLGPEANRARVPDASRPTLVFFDGLTVAWCGLDARWHHAISIALHLLTTALLVAWIRRAGADHELQIATALIFGLMGIHAQAIAVVSFREDLLAASLGLGACLSAATALDRRGAAGWGYGAVAFVLQCLAVGAKWSALPLPLVFALVHVLAPWGRERDRRWILGMTFTMLAASMAALAMAWWVLDGQSPYGDAMGAHTLVSRIPAREVWLASVVILARRLTMMVVPWGLAPETVDRGMTWTDPGVALIVLGLGAGLLYAVACGVSAMRSRDVGGNTPSSSWRAGTCVAVFAWFALVVPVSNVVPMPNMDAERFMYLPSAPIAVALAAVALQLGSSWAARAGTDGDAVMRQGPVLILATLQGIALASGIRPYASNTTLWDAALRHAPGSARAHAMVGLQLAATLDVRELVDADLRRRALVECRIAASHDPWEELAHVCRARVALVDRDFATAAAAMDTALDIPSFRRDRLLAVAIELALDDPRIPWDERAERALTFAGEALTEYPYSVEVAASAARVAHRVGAPHFALELLRRVRSLRPERWETVADAVEIALDQGDIQLAASTYLADRALLARAPEARRRSLLRRLTFAQRAHPTNLLHSALAPGAFRQ